MYIAAIYVGPAIGSLAAADVIECLVSLAFFGVALVARRGSNARLAAGYLGQGWWDAAHSHVIHAALPSGYAPMCLGFDWVAAAWMVLVLPRRPPAAVA